MGPPPLSTDSLPHYARVLRLGLAIRLPFNWTILGATELQIVVCWVGLQYPMVGCVKIPNHGNAGTMRTASVQSSKGGGERSLST